MDTLVIALPISTEATSEKSNQSINLDLSMKLRHSLGAECGHMLQQSVLVGLKLKMHVRNTQITGQMRSVLTAEM